MESSELIKLYFANIEMLQNAMDKSDLLVENLLKTLYFTDF